MKFLILLSAWLAFAAIASAQDCDKGKCARVTVVYTFPAPTPQPTARYTLQAPPVCVTCQVPTTAPTVVYYEVRPARRGCGWFRCR